MPKDKKPESTRFFWQLAESLLLTGQADEGSLMGFPCLRVDGDFFATCQHQTGELILKLPKARVLELIEEGTGLPFAPAGRIFAEWVMVPERDEAHWLELMAEARAYVAGSRIGGKKR